MAKDATAVTADALYASRGASSLTKGHCPLHVVEGLRNANCHPFVIFFRIFFGLAFVKGEGFGRGNSDERFFQPVEMVVIVIADGATALAQDRTDLFEAVPKNQQIENLPCTLIHQLSQFTDQDLLVQLSASVVA